MKKIFFLFCFWGRGLHNALTILSTLGLSMFYTFYLTLECWKFEIFKWTIPIIYKRTFVLEDTLNFLVILLSLYTTICIPSPFSCAHNCKCMRYLCLHSTSNTFEDNKKRRLWDYYLQYFTVLQINFSVSSVGVYCCLNVFLKLWDRAQCLMNIQWAILERVPYCERNFKY